MNTKQLWLLAGGNGAGKSTFYRTQLEPLNIPFVNADVIAKQLYPDAPEENSYHASVIAEQLRYKLIREQQSFCFETVFSHHSKIDFVAHAKAMGYQIILVFIHLESDSLNKARVSQRVVEGGHHVPDEKVVSRIPRLLENIKTIIPMCDQVRALDNSSSLNPFELVFTIRNGDVVKHITQPRWAEYLLS